MLVTLKGMEVRVTSDQREEGTWLEAVIVVVATGVEEHVLPAAWHEEATDVHTAGVVAPEESGTQQD